MLARTGQRIALSTGRAALPRCSRWVRHASESASEGFEAGMGREERQYEKAGRKVYLRDTKAKASPGIKFPQRDIFPYKPADLAKKDLEQHGFGNELPSSPNENHGAARPHTDNSPAAQAARRDIADPKQKATTDPYILGPRLMNIYKYVGRAMAVTELANAKKEAKTVPVHNMLIQMLLREGQVDLAFRVWMDMKRGGLIPTPQSYTVFFAALNPRMFRGAFRDKVYTIFKQWQEFAIRVRQKGTREYELAQAQPEEYTLSAIPTNAFLTMMYRSGTYEAEPIAKAIEVLLDMDTFAPTKETFAILFMTLRAILDNPGYGRSIPIAQNMALFQRGWDLMWKRVTREESIVDGHSLSCALTLLRDIHRLEPRIISQNQRLNYLQQVEWLLDLEDPNELVPDIRKKATGRIRKKDTSVLVDAFSLAAAFEGKYSRHVLKWFERVRKDHHELLESRLCAIYIKASPQNAFDTLLMMLESKRKQLRPSRHHWNIIMGSCDFWDQVRILAYKTGKEELLEPGEKTLDEMLEEYSESGRALPDWDRKFERQKYVPPDAMEVILLLDTAIKSKDYRRVDRALKVAEHLTFMGTALQQKTIVPSSNGVYSDNFPRMREVYWDACEVLLENKNISDKRKAQIQGWKDSGLFPIIQGKLEARKPAKKQKLLEERRTPEQVLKQLREGKSAASPQYKFKLPAVKPRPVEDFSPSVTKATEEFQPLASEAA